MKKIKMKDAGESPEFGIFESGQIFDETKIDSAGMQVLVDREVAEWVDENKVKEAADNGK